MKKALMVGTMFLLVGGVLGCGGSSSKDDCGDIAKKACQRLYDCGYAFSVDGVTTVSEAVCTSQVDAILAGNGTSDQECRDEWDTGGDLACADFFVWFNQD